MNRMVGRKKARIAGPPPSRSGELPPSWAGVDADLGRANKYELARDCIAASQDTMLKPGAWWGDWATCFGAAKAYLASSTEKSRFPSGAVS